MPTEMTQAAAGGGPRSLGRYELCTRIAVGGMAEVYLARHGDLAGLQTLVVIKRILPHLAADPNFIGMFLDEARIAAHLDHPNVARTFEVGRAGDEYFLALELVQGESLATLLDRGQEIGRPVPHRLVVLAAAQAAAGLHHAHTARDAEGQPLNIVHRDVSPSNILVSFDGAVKVIDFGIARAIGRLAHTQGGNVKGTFAYMSPEQARGQPVDARSDVFSLGIALWEAVCGQRLFDRGNALSAQQAIMDETPPLPSTLVELSAQLERIVLRCLEKDPTRRYPSAQELQIALEKVLFSEGAASARELGQLMRAMLPDHYQRWQAAVRAARPGPRAGDDEAAGAGGFEGGAATVVMSGAPSFEGFAVPAAAAASTPVAGDRSRPVEFDQQSTVFAPEVIGALARKEADVIDDEVRDLIEGGGQPFAPLPTGPTVPIPAALMQETAKAASSSLKPLAAGAARPAAESARTPPPSARTPPPSARAPSPVATSARRPAAAAPFVLPTFASAPDLRDRRPAYAIAILGGVLLVAGVTALIFRSSGKPDQAAAASTAAPAKETPSQATVFLVTEPRGASILLDGEPTASVTPTAVKVKPGMHVIRLEKPGYEAQNVPIAVAPGDEKMIDRMLLGTAPPTVGEPPAAEPAASKPADKPKKRATKRAAKRSGRPR